MVVVYGETRHGASTSGNFALVRVCLLITPSDSKNRVQRRAAPEHAFLSRTSTGADEMTCIVQEKCPVPRTLSAANICVVGVDEVGNARRAFQRDVPSAACLQHRLCVAGLRQDRRDATDASGAIAVMNTTALESTRDAHARPSA